MRKLAFNLAVLAILGTLGCGKNQAVYPAGYAPFNRAPGYPTGYSAYPPTGYPSYGNGAFNPQLPPGYPAAYTPFLPVDYYMRNNPQLAPYWPGYWNGWVNYANQYGYSPYDFSRFWYGYMPQQWNSGSWYHVYGYLNQNFYSWANPQMAFAPQMNPALFWANYSGFGF